MGLRLRVVVMLVVLVVPVTVAFSSWRVGAERRVRQERAAERAAERALARPRVLQRCLQDPEAFAINRRNLRARAVIDAGDAARLSGPNPPALDPALWARFATSGEGIAHQWSWRGDRAGASIVRVGDGDGPCAVFWVGWPDTSPRLAAATRRSILLEALALLLLLVATGAIIAAPLVRRIRRLTEVVVADPLHAISDHDAAARELRTGDEIGALARALEARTTQVKETIAELQARDQTLKEYISNTTHDLAIPLTVLQHRLMGLKDATSRGEAADVEVIERALEESHYIAALIANMSAAAKLDAGRAHTTRHPVNLGELVERVAARHQPIAAQKDVEINWAAPDDLIVLGDSTLIEQAVSNLVQNAIQYHGGGGHVAIVADHADGGRFELRVLDDGPGVDEATLPRLTERGVRADASRTRNPGGQGFGLSIALRVFDAHAWRFDMTSPPGEGLTNIITGPAQPPGSLAGQAAT